VHVIRLVFIGTFRARDSFSVFLVLLFSGSCLFVICNANTSVKVQLEIKSTSIFAYILSSEDRFLYSQTDKVYNKSNKKYFIKFFII